MRILPDHACDRDEPSSPKPGGVDQPGPASMVPLDRAAALAAPPERIPRKVLVVAVACFAVLGLGGMALDHVFTGPSSATTAAPNDAAYPPPPPAPTTGATTATPTPQLPASLSAFMGLERTTPAAARPFSLTDQRGHLVSLASLKGKVVVLTFFDAACDDICPVLATELSEAYEDLGPLRSQVAFVTVNTDPLALDARSAAAAGSAASMSSLPGWYFLTGSLSQLDSVWTSYGVAVEVERATGTVSHNDVMDFIDPTGRLRLQAAPFADETGSAAYSLSTTSETSWATGIADQVESLLTGRP
jgi:cytochrome oxidase Cu insertion factor (SCO1/SenC/PrrC family)